MTLRRFFEITVGGPIFIFLEIVDKTVAVSKVIFWPLLVVVLGEIAILLYLLIIHQANLVQAWSIFK